MTATRTGAPNTRNVVMAVGLLLCVAAGAGQAQAQAAGQQRPGSALTAPRTPAEIEATRPNPQAPGFRIPLPPLDQMEPAQREAFIANSAQYPTPVGPRVPLMLTPEVGAAWAGFGAALQKSALPQDIYELTIMMTAAEWRANFEWWVHESQALKSGLSPAVLEAIRRGRRPKFDNPGQEATYQFMVELLGEKHRVSDATYERLRAIIGTRQIVELTAVAGHYTNVSMGIVAHGIPIRSDVKPPFPERK